MVYAHIIYPAVNEYKFLNSLTPWLVNGNLHKIFEKKANNRFGKY